MQRSGFEITSPHNEREAYSRRRSSTADLTTFTDILSTLQFTASHILHIHKVPPYFRSA